MNDTRKTARPTGHEPVATFDTPAWGTLAAELREVLQGAVARPGDPLYTQSTTLWNGAVRRRPGLVARCETVSDVQAALRAAQAHGIPVSVRSGGNDWVGRALRDGGLVIDLTRLDHVAVNPAERVATVGGGATSRQLIDAAAAHGLVATTGIVGYVGVVGLALGGGYGPLSGQYGLALDNLLGAEVVLADGRVVSASATEEPDLFWALRGGGGNFGVVTSVQMHLHPGGPVLSGSVLYPGSEAAQVLVRYGELLAQAPDELTVMASLVSGPDGRLMVNLTPTWSGELARGQAVVEALNHLGTGTPALSQLGPMSYGEVLDRTEARIAVGVANFMENRWVGALTPAVVAVLVAAGASKPSAQCVINLPALRGAAARVPPEATAFGQRQVHFDVQIAAAWDPGASEAVGEAHRRWARDTSAQLAALALPGGYANVLAPDATDQILAAYGPTADRLRHLKRRFDPAGVFAAIPLPTGRR